MKRTTTNITTRMVSHINGLKVPFLFLAIIALTATQSVAAPTEEQTYSCLMEMGAIEEAKPASGSGGFQIQQTTILPKPYLRRVMAHACFYLDIKSINEMVDTSLSLPTSNIDQFKDLKVVQGTPTGYINEPGVFGLDGGEDMLAEMLVAEAYGLWSVGIQNGSFLEPPTDSEVQAYVDYHLDGLKESGDVSLPLRIRMFDRLQEVLLSRETPSLAMQRFVKSLESYIRDEYVRMARTAKKKYGEYKAEQLRLANQGTNNIYYMGPDPFNPLKEMTKAVGISAGTAIFIAGNKAARDGVVKNGSISKKAADIFAAFEEADELDDLGKQAAWFKGNKPSIKPAFVKKITIGTKGATTSSVSKAIGKVAKLPSKLAGKLAGKAAIVGTKIAIFMGLKAAVNVIPVVGQVIDALISAGEAVYKVVDNANIERQINGAEQKFRATKWDLKEMLNTRQGYELALLYFAKATSDQSPAYVVAPPPPACRVCFFDDKNYAGESFCTNSRVSDLRNFSDGISNRNFNNKPSSVKIFGDQSCEKPRVVLHENQRHSGDTITLNESAPDLSAFRRNATASWDNDVTSVEYFRTGGTTNSCEVCFFTRNNYKGNKVCIDQEAPSLHALGIGDKISSLKFNTKSCPDARVWAYRKKNFKRTKRGAGIIDYANDTPSVGKEWNNSFSSAFFSPSGSNPKEEKPTTGCRVCMFEHPNYIGEYACVLADDKIPHLNKLKAGIDTIKFANKASSAVFLTDSCKAGETLQLELFSRADYKGSRVVLNERSADLGNFKNKATSTKLTVISAQDQANACQVCLYSGANYAGDKKCYSADATTQQLAFNNKAKSVKFEMNGCKTTGGAMLYENNMSGHQLYRYANVADLSKIKRGNNAHWSGQISSLKFSKTLRSNVEAAVLKARQQAAAAAAAAAVAAQSSCQVCLYSGTNYAGDKKCYTANATTQQLAFNNRAKSVKFEMNGCKTTGGAMLYENNMSGHQLYRYANVADLSKIRRGNNAHWSGQISSLKFSRTLRRDVEAAALKARQQAAAAAAAAVAAQKKCQICVYEHANYGGKNFCTGPRNVPKLKDHGLNNRLSSIKFVGNNCSRSRFILYEDPNYKSYTKTFNKSVPKLSAHTLRKGGKKTWNDVADSFRFENY